jgi:subtilisin-like proprotein convertase family protein
MKKHAFVAAFALIFAISHAPAAQALIYSYPNTTSGSIGDNNCPNGITRTFSVTESYTVNMIALGLNLTHTSRGQVRATLIAPNGTSQQLFNNGSDTNNNYDILLSSNTEGVLDDNQDDPTGEPYFNRIVPDTDILFYTGNAQGTWTLRLCDAANSTTGTFNRAMLILGSAEAATPVCSSRTVANWSDNGNGNGFTNRTYGNVVVTQTEAQDFGSDGVAGNFVTQTGSLGGETGYYALFVDADGTPGDGDPSTTVGERVTFSFSQPAYDLTFRIVDADFTTDDFEDQVRVYAVNAAGNRVPFTLTTLGIRHQQAGDMIEGDTSDSADNSTNGTFRVTFSGAVSAVSIEYGQGDEPSEGADDQKIGIGDFEFCAYDFGDAPTSYGGNASHPLGQRTIYLGTTPPDGEPVTPAAPGTAAGVDDGALPAGGADDEDAISAFPLQRIVANGTYSMTNIPVTNTSGAAVTLCAWLDFDINGQAGDGSFAADEGVCVTVPASGNNAACTATGTNPNRFACNLTFNVPSDFVYRYVVGEGTYARFRVAPSSAGMTTASFNTAITSAGEVEDYRIPEGTLPVTVAWVRAMGNVLQWITSSETSNLGFRLYEQRPDGGLVLLGQVASQAVDSSKALGYRLDAGRALRYPIVIEEIDTTGKTRRHGPYAVGQAIGEVPADAVIDWPAARAELGLGESARGADPWAIEPATGFATDIKPSARVLVRESGIQRLTHADLLAAGLDLTGRNVADLALVNNGQAVARFVEGGAQWSAASAIEFYFSPRLSLASPFDALELRFDPRLALAARNLVAPNGVGQAVTYRKALAAKPDHAYSFGAPNGDPFFDGRILAFGAPARIERTFDLPALAAGATTLKLELWGVTDFDGPTPDHHVIVRLNGGELASSTFDGLTTWTRTFDVAHLAQENHNVLEIELPLDSGYLYDLVHLEGFTVDHARRATAQAGRLDGTVSSLRPWQADGFAGQAVSLWANGGRASLTASRGSVTLPGVSGEFALAEPAAQHRPTVVAGIPTTAPNVGKTDYLIVAHPAFLGSLDSLVGLQQARGLRTAVTSTEAIYARYSDHAPSAEAIQRFIKDQAGLRYVLLVGAESYDPYDHLHLGSISFVPTLYTKINQFVNFAPSDDLIADRSGDQMPDLAIGRLPVRTPSELDAVVAKLWAWQERQAGKQALLVGGRSTEGRELSDTVVDYAASLPSWSLAAAKVDDLGTQTVRDQALAALDAGTPLISYVGHSSYGQWDTTPVLRWQDVAGLNNVELPSLVTQWGCWNAYFASPEVETLSNHLLLTPEVGAAGVVGSTTLTSTASHRRLGALFLQRVGKGDRTIGDALINAKRELGIGGIDAVLGEVLLGDPATPLPQ